MFVLSSLILYLTLVALVKASPASPGEHWPTHFGTEDVPGEHNSPQHQNHPAYQATSSYSLDSTPIDQADFSDLYSYLGTANPDPQRYQIEPQQSPQFGNQHETQYYGHPQAAQGSDHSYDQYNHVIDSSHYGGHLPETHGYGHTEAAQGSDHPYGHYNHILESAHYGGHLPETLGYGHPEAAQGSDHSYEHYNHILESAHYRSHRSETHGYGQYSNAHNHGQGSSSGMHPGQSAHPYVEDTTEATMISSDKERGPFLLRPEYEQHEAMIDPDSTYRKWNFKLRKSQITRIQAAFRKRIHIPKRTLQDQIEKYCTFRMANQIVRGTPSEQESALGEFQALVAPPTVFVKSRKTVDKVPQPNHLGDRQDEIMQKVAHAIRFREKYVRRMAKDHLDKDLAKKLLSDETFSEGVEEFRSRFPGYSSSQG